MTADVGPAHIVLASSSEARQTMLRRAGVSFVYDPPAIDEDAIRQQAEAAGMSMAATALALAEAKARTVAARQADALVLGADQILYCRGRIFTKPDDLDAAEATLRALRGRTHCLISAAAIVRGGAMVWSRVETARLTMRSFSDAFLHQYLAETAAGALSSVGVYRIEGAGIQLFSDIDGDHSTILGLPLLPLLAFFRSEGILPE